MPDESDREPESVEEVLAFIAENPCDKELYQRLGGLYLKERELSKAWDAYMAALRLDPDDPFTCLYFANLLRIFDKERAMKLYRRARKLAPELAVVHWCIAELYRSRGDYYRAGKAYNQAVKVEPDCEMSRGKLEEWRTFVAERERADVGTAEG